MGGNFIFLNYRRRHNNNDDDNDNDNDNQTPPMLGSGLLVGLFVTVSQSVGAVVPSGIHLYD
jgi:hypothetical protein